MGWAPTGLAPLRREGYRLLWTSSLFWNLARWADILVGGWLALELTGSAWHVALIGFFRSAPLPLLGAFAGAIADRVDRRRLVLAAQALNVGATLAVAGLLLLGRLEYWHLAAANLALGVAWAVEWPSRRAMLPDLAGRDLLLPAIVLDTVSMNVTKVLGPIAGGALLSALGTRGCYVLLVVLYTAALLPILKLRPPDAGPQPRAAPLLRFMVEGLSFCRRHPAVRGALLVTVAMNCFAFPYVQLLPVFARDILQVGPLGLGLLAAGDGVGSLLGAGALSSPRAPRRQGMAFVLGSLGMCAALGLFAVSPLFGASLALLVVGGFAHSAFSTYQSTIILSAAGDALRGRAMGVLTLAIGSAPVGMLVLGALAGSLGAPAAVGLSSIAGGILVGWTGATTPGLRAHGVRSDVARSDAAPEPCPPQGASARMVEPGRPAAR